MSNLYLSGDGVSYSGGDGSSIDEPVVIHAQTTQIGVPAEYSYVTKRYGKRGEDWDCDMQYKLKSQNGREIDSLVIKLANGEIISLYFDITEFFGKF